MWGAEQPRVFAPVARCVLLHASCGSAENADLECLLRGDQATVIAATTHNCRRCGRRHRLAEWSRSRAVVVFGFIAGGVVAADRGIGVAAVGVKIARDLSVNGVCC